MTLMSTALPPALAGRRRPEGDPHELRAVASRLSSAAERYDSAARRLLTRTGALPEVWRGTAATAAWADLVSLQARARQAADRHLEAAEVLLTCAARLDEAQATWQRAEGLERQDAMERAAGAARGELPALHDAGPLREQARRLADEAQGEADEALARAAARLRELAGRAPVESGLSARDQVSGFGRGAVEAISGSVSAVAGLSLPRMLADPAGWLEQVRGLRDGAAYAVAHPREALEAAAGWDLLREGRFGEWSGALAPDLLGAAFTGGGLPVARRGADLADDLGDLTEDVDDLQRVHGRSFDANAGGPVQPRPGAHLPHGYVTVIRDLTPERRTHILDGDRSGGGHRAGTGHRCKTEFPADWSDDEVIRRVMETARRPQSAIWQAKRDTFFVTAEHAGVIVTAIVNKHGEVRTGYPRKGGTGVVNNPC
jgi:uncharacterized protein YukE